MIYTSVINLLARYLKKRIFMPITPNDFVLDVGGGDKPFWRANVILDKFPYKEGSSQRYTGMDINLNRDQVLVVGDAEKMPFKNSSFDFIYCSHLLEHVIDPEKVLKEMMRVGKKGYIEVPLSAIQKIKDMPSHLWFTFLNKDVLNFVAKKKVEYEDLDFNFIRKLFDKYNLQVDPEDLLVSFFWERKIKYKIKGKAKLSLLKASQTANLDRPKLLSHKFYRYSNLLLPYILFWKRYRGGKKLKDVLKK